ncbi:hypothetical protein So717_36570 [Roseobacter cerasinus]|uniref:Transposase n=1 Tax=Roseobacter cerasinus TaxID=2602289 RepID=A0A640VWC1_9RHOB|nr:hypothetical protein So717_36570 [Roseobacter cerasinus]
MAVWKCRTVSIDCTIGSSNNGDKLRALEDENAQLKRLLADQMLDNVVLKGLLGKS